MVALVLTIVFKSSVELKAALNINLRLKKDFNYRAHRYKLEQIMFKNYTTLITFSKLISLKLEIVMSAK